MYATVYEPTREELARSLPLISDIPAVQAHYEYCRIMEGTSHQLAEMFAWQQPPFGMTDDVFNAGRVNGNQFEGQEWIGQQYQAAAKAAGVSTTGATYLHGLAAYPGDPKAWVRSRGDVQRVCEERGWGCQGAVSVQAREPSEDPRASGAVADDIVDTQVAKEMANNPGLAFERAADVREAVREKLTPAWVGKKTPKRKLDLAA